MQTQKQTQLKIFPGRCQRLCGAQACSERWNKWCMETAGKAELVFIEVSSWYFDTVLNLVLLQRRCSEGAGVAQRLLSPAPRCQAGLVHSDPTTCWLEAISAAAKQRGRHCLTCSLGTAITWDQKNLCKWVMYDITGPNEVKALPSFSRLEMGKMLHLKVQDRDGCWNVVHTSKLSSNCLCRMTRSFHKTLQDEQIQEDHCVILLSQSALSPRISYKDNEYSIA